MSPKKRHERVAEMQPEYDFSNGLRGKYSERYRSGVTVHVVQSAPGKSLAVEFDDGGPIDAAQLADLLFLFRGAYAAGIKSSRTRRAPVPASQFGQSVREYIRRLNVGDLDLLFTCDLGADSLVTTSISHQSPMRMHVSGSLDGLLAAVTLAGASSADVRSKPMEVKLASIANVAELLRTVLVRGVGAPIGFGVRARRLKLSKDELRELLRHDPATEKRGGFQRFLIGLQTRVNRVSGELDLSEAEMGTILKHGRDPSRGGWQTSIRKIFANHFDFDTG